MSKTILIADDDDKILNLIESRLKAEGYEVIKVSDGEAAIQKARTENPDLIILDVMMPKLDGTEAGRLLREDERTRRIPVIYLTALKSESDDIEDESFGVSFVLPKPFNPVDLMEKIKTLIKS